MISERIQQLLQNDRGVSPVIGVVLMVLVTIVLASTVMILTTGMVDDVDETVTAGVAVDQADGETTVTWTATGTATEIRFGGDWESAETIDSVGGTATNADLEAGDRITVIASNEETDSETIVKIVEITESGAGG